MPVIPPAVKKKRVLPTIAPEDMTPQGAAMLAFAEEALRLRDATYEEGVALRRELAQLRRAKKGATGTPNEAAARRAGD